MAAESPEEVDRVMQNFWVGKYLRKENPEEGSQKWIAYTNFIGHHIPRATLVSTSWNVERVKKVLGLMKEKASPGARGLPIAMWKVAPQGILEAVAHLPFSIWSKGMVDGPGSAPRPTSQ